MRLATVVGAAGFIGSRLAARLGRDGWTCRAPARDDPVRRGEDLGTVFYCAGLTADFAKRPHDTVRAHAGHLNDVLEHGAFDALVYLSSTRLYDGSRVAGAESIDESTPLCLDSAEPRHLFDLSKALGESLCRHASGGRARVARLSCVYAGAGDTEGFLGELLRRLREPHPREQALTVDSSLQAARDYVHVDDVLDALIRIGTAGTEPVYNVAGGVNVGNAELFARIGALAGRELRALRAGAASAAPVLSIERMHREFGWRPTPLADRLPAMVEEALAC